MISQAPSSTHAGSASTRSRSAAGGTSLVEVLVATLVFAVGAAALVPLVAGSVRATRSARDVGLATWMAWQKLEELRGLSHARDVTGVPLTDTWTDTTQEPLRHAGGTGLSPSPSSSLVQDTSGYVDYLGQNGRQSPAPGVYVRRWAIEPVGADGLLRIAVAVHHVGAPGLVTTVATLRARRTP
jgi:type II secretory pathway pseudopilin PulG